MAILQFTYCSGSGLSGQKRVYYDDILHKVTNGEGTGFMCLGSPPENLYEHEDDGYTYTVYPQSFYPFAYVEKTVFVPPVSCNVAIVNIEVGDTTDGFVNGTLEIEATSSFLPVRYKLDNGGYQDSNVFVRVNRGDHVVTVRDAQGCEATQAVNVGPNSDLAIDDIVVVNQSPTELGSITVVASSSNEPIQYQLRTGIFSYQASNVFEDLEAGSYTLNVKDATGIVLTRTVYVGQDQFSPVEPFIACSIANAFRFIKAGTPGFDGLLHRQESHAGFYQKPYFLPVQKSDPSRIQILSTYDTNILEVFDEAANLQATIVGEKVVDNTNVFELASGVMSSAGAGKTKISFGLSSDLPASAAAGMQVQVSGSDTMDNIYEIETVYFSLRDFGGVSDYIIIPVDYTEPNVTKLVQATFLPEADYDVWEFDIDWTAIPAGRYNWKMSGAMNGSTYELIGEPIDLRDTQKNTVLISYKNIDNAYDIDYSTGIEHVIRVAGRFYERSSAGQRKVHKDSKNSLVKVSAWRQRRVKLEVWQLPPWVHEKLELVFDHDYFTINGVEYQTEEDYEYTYHEDYSLHDGEIVVTQVNGFTASNSDDNGDVDTAYLKVNEGYLKI